MPHEQGEEPRVLPPCDAELLEHVRVSGYETKARPSAPVHGGGREAAVAQRCGGGRGDGEGIDEEQSRRIRIYRTGNRKTAQATSGCKVSTENSRIAVKHIEVACGPKDGAYQKCGSKAQDKKK